MRVRDFYTFIYRVEKVEGELSSDIVGYGPEVPQPDEEHPNQWEVLSVTNQIGPDVEWGHTWVVSKKYFGRMANHFMDMFVDETMDDFYEVEDGQEYIYPTPVNVNMMIAKMKEFAENDWQKEMADHIPEVILEAEWQSDSKPFDYTKYLSLDVIMERLQEKYGDGDD